MHRKAEDEIDAQLREQIPRLRRFALWLTRDTNQADDLVQTTLERALTHWRSRRDPGALRPWLFSIAYRKFVDLKRRDRRHARALETLLNEPTLLAPSAEREATAQATLDALQQLPDEQRLLLLWVSVEGMKYREVAALLDVPIGTVMSRLSRARSSLRRLAEGSMTPASPHLLRLLK